MPSSGYMVLASDSQGERCEGLFVTLKEALDTARVVVEGGFAEHSWVATLIVTTQAFTKGKDGNLTKT